MENPSWDCFIGRTGKPVCSAQAGSRGGLCVSARHDSQRAIMQRPTHPRRANRKSPKWPLPILALAIFLVAFGSLALGSTIFATAKNAQLAAAIETTSKNCDAAKQAAAKGVSSGSQSGTGQNIADKCIAAVFDQAKVQLNEQNPRQNPKNYKCVGKSVKVSIDSKGKITESWNASAGVPQGTCSTRYCDASGCKPAKQTSGINGSQMSELEQLPQSQSQQQMPQLPQANGVEQLPQSNNPTVPDQNYHDLGTQYPSEPPPQPTQNKSWWDNIQQYLGIQPADAPSPDTRAENTSPGSPQSSYCCDTYFGSSDNQVQLEQDISTLQPSENALNQSITPPPESPPLRDYPYSNSTFSAQDTLQSDTPLIRDPWTRAREDGYPSLIDTPYFVADSATYLWNLAFNPSNAVSPFSYRK